MRSVISSNAKLAIPKPLKSLTYGDAVVEIEIDEVAPPRHVI